jgi:hypothetical protein
MAWIRVAKEALHRSTTRINEPQGGNPTRNPVRAEEAQGAHPLSSLHECSVCALIHEPLHRCRAQQNREKVCDPTNPRGSSTGIFVFETNSQVFLHVDIYANVKSEV